MAHTKPSVRDPRPIHRPGHRQGRHQRRAPLVEDRETIRHDPDRRLPQGCRRPRFVIGLGPVESGWMIGEIERLLFVSFLVAHGRLRP